MTDQIPMFDLTTVEKPAGRKRSRRRVAEIYSQLHILAEELNSALYSSQLGERPKIQSPIDAFNALFPFIGQLDHEELWVVLLNTRNCILALIKLYQGSVNSSQVRVGEVFKAAIEQSAPQLILAHNHPSGDPTPSPEDVALTRAIVQAGKLLDIAVLDHIILVCGRYVSLKERGLGFS